MCISASESIPISASSVSSSGPPPAFTGSSGPPPNYTPPPAPQPQPQPQPQPAMSSYPPGRPGPRAGIGTDPRMGLAPPSSKRSSSGGALLALIAVCLLVLLAFSYYWFRVRAH